MAASHCPHRTTSRTVSNLALLYEATAGCSLSLRKSDHRVKLMHFPQREKGGFWFTVTGFSPMIPPKTALHLVRCWDSDRPHSDTAAVLPLTSCQRKTMLWVHHVPRLKKKKKAYRTTPIKMELRSTNMAATATSSIAFLSL